MQLSAKLRIVTIAAASTAPMSSAALFGANAQETDRIGGILAKAVTGTAGSRNMQFLATSQQATRNSGETS